MDKIKVLLIVVLTLSKQIVTSENSNNTDRNGHGMDTKPNYTDIDAKLLSLQFENAMSDYDKKFRPYFGGPSTNVSLNIHVLSFNRIDESAMEYSIDFYFAQSWTDPRFIDKSNNFNPNKNFINLIGTEVDRLWLPDVVFVNSKSSRFHGVTINNRFLTIVFETGFLVYHSRITTTASCRMDLRDYPFDVQTCFLAIESYGHDERSIKFDWFDPTNQNCTTAQCERIKVYDREMSNFDVVEALKSKNMTTYHAQGFSSATAKFTFKRRSKYFILQVYLPCICIVAVTWASFWITPKAVPARTAICVTTILTLITMLGIVNANMPRVSYVKALDLYLLVAFLFVLLSLLEYILVLNIQSTFSGIKRKKLGKRLANFFGRQRTANHSDFEGSSHHQHRLLAEGTNETRFRSNVYNSSSEKESTVIELEKNNNTTEDVGKTSPKPVRPINDGTSYATCDVISRFLFPCGFIIFNMGYWVAYLTQQKEYQPMA